MPVVWSDQCRLHEPLAEIWIGTRTPATEVPERIDAIRAALDAREVERLTQMSDEEWWALSQPLLKDLVDPARYPTIVRVGEAYKAIQHKGPSLEQNFEFGLQRVLDGIAAFIAQRQRASASAG